LEESSLILPGIQQRLDRWKGMLTQGISLLEPGSPSRGPVVTRWRLRVNISI